MKMFYDKDADLNLLKEKTIAVIGYGSQGHAQAQNLKDSGLNVIIGHYRDIPEAVEYGFKVMGVDEAAEKADIVNMLIPDQVQAKVYIESVAKHMTAGKVLCFSHGFNIHFGQILPPADIDVIMVAPKSPGHMVRRMYSEGAGVPSLVAVHQDATGTAMDIALAYAKGIGSTKAGVFETNFKEETETDLFGEQAVICGGVAELIKAGFDTLVGAGYAPEMAYFECLHEMKLIVDLIYEGGLSYMRYSISETAEYGDYVVGPRIITDETRAEMKQVLYEIQSGQFAREWLLENSVNKPVYSAMKKAGAEHQIEQVGKRLREMMPWLKRK